MTSVTIKSQAGDDLTYIRLAREIAFNHRELDEILKMFELTPAQWDRISKDTRFQELLKTEVESWESAGNTKNRAELKMAAMTEEALPEMYAMLHDRAQPLSARVELFKVIKAGGGVGLNDKSSSGDQAERFSITINLGAGNKVRFEKDVTPKVIEGELLTNEVR